jgi:hypothetical protein
VYKEHPESHEASAESRDISEKHNFHGVCEHEERDQLASFRVDILPHGSPLKLLREDGSKPPDVLCVTPIVYKEHPESHEVSFLVMDRLSFSPVFVFEEELEKESLSIYQGKGLFDFLREKANKVLCVASVPEHEECFSIIGVGRKWAGGRRDSYKMIYLVIVDRIVADNTRVVKIADVPSTIWATMTGHGMGGKRVMNIIIMGCHEDCTRSHEAEGQGWISWREAGSLERMNSFSHLELEEHVNWVQDLLWNCNNLIIFRRGLMPKSVVPSSFPSIFLMGRKRRFGNSTGNEDIINITRQQQVKLLTFTSISLCSSDILPPRKVIPPNLFPLRQSSE